MHRGDVDAAARRLERFAEMQESADVQEVAEHACGAATLHLAGNDPKEALRFAEIAMAERDALSFGHSCVKESIALGLEAALRLDDRDKVEEILEIIRTNAVCRRTRYYLAHAARIEASSPDRPEDEAERLFAESIEAFRRIQTPFPIAVVLLEFGEWLDRRGRGRRPGTRRGGTFDLRRSRSPSVDRARRPRGAGLQRHPSTWIVRPATRRPPTGSISRIRSWAKGPSTWSSSWDGSRTSS